MLGQGGGRVADWEVVEQVQEVVAAQARVVEMGRLRVGGADGGGHTHWPLPITDL